MIQLTNWQYWHPRRYHYNKKKKLRKLRKLAFSLWRKKQWRKKQWSTFLMALLKACHLKNWSVKNLFWKIDIEDIIFYFEKIKSISKNNYLQSKFSKLNCLILWGVENMKTKHEAIKSKDKKHFWYIFIWIMR